MYSGEINDQVTLARQKSRTVPLVPAQLAGYKRRQSRTLHRSRKVALE
jgi:hypothetical protein